MKFAPPESLVIVETNHWIVNHRVDAKLPGYLMIGARAETPHLFDLPSAALSELGPLLAIAQKTLLNLFGPDHVYISKHGHMPGHPIHFHIIPVYSWVKESFAADPRYCRLQALYTPGALTSDFDGAELTLYIWREFCESRTPPPIHGPTLAEAVAMLRERLATIPGKIDGKPAGNQLPRTG